MIKEKVANRGMDWEKIINKKCEEYRMKGEAFIFKLPTEWQVQRSGKKIVSAFPKCKSLVDYFGTLKDGRAISIEAKRTTNTTSFPFTNIKEHQYKFFEDWNKTSELGYFLIWFKTQDKKFLVHSNKILEARKTLDRKSIPYNWFEENAILLDNELNFVEEINNLKEEELMR